ncbi:MAG TPA: hypothetical protein VMC80_02280 [Patescibacteria group bacterium]|nr:hypothetical protein [Patescibacteria group bacterium]
MGEKIQKCIYCQAEIHDDRPLTVCNKCGVQVWGEKMFFAIVGKMERARENGDLSLYKEQDDIVSERKAA